MKRFRFALMLTVFGAGGLEAQQPAVRTLGAVVAKTVQPGRFAGVRALGSGGVLVNDIPGRRVLLFDESLSNYTVIADSTSATANAYSGRMAGLIAYRGDSTLFVDPQSMSMLVLDPAGKVARVVSIPRSEDAMGIAGAMLGASRYDPAGRIVYRAPPNLRRIAGGPGAPQRQPGSVPMIPEFPDSAPLVRVDLATRQLDTVTFIKVPRMSMRVNRSDDGNVSMTSEVNPLPVVDDWTLLPDGSIAIVRGADYRIEIIAPDGAKRASQRLQFEWQRLSDEDKVAFIDSVKASYERAAANTPPGSVSVPMGMGGPAMGQIVIREGGPAGGRGPAPDQRAFRPTFVEPDKLPDYRPAFFANSMSTDTEGNVWIQTTKTVNGGFVYDVVNSSGQLVDKVQVPAGRTIAAFGAGVVYLASRDGTNAVLEKVSLR